MSLLPSKLMNVKRTTMSLAVLGGIGISLATQQFAAPESNSVLPGGTATPASTVEQARAHSTPHPGIVQPASSPENQSAPPRFRFTPPANTSLAVDVSQSGPVTRSKPAQTNPALQTIATHGGDKLVDVVLCYDSLPSAATLKAIGAKTQRVFPAVGMVVLRVPAGALTNLSYTDGISLIALDEDVGAASSFARKTANMPVVNSSSYPAIPSDMKIAPLDTGISDV